MTGTVAVLTLHIPEPGCLAAVFGAAATERALADFGAAADALIARLLAQHETLEHRRRDHDGRWTTAFRVLAGGMPRDAGETCAAIEAAGRKLVHDHLVAVFGAGTGMRVPFVLAVFPLPAAADAPDVLERQAAWIDERLAALSQPAAPSTAASGEVADILAARSVRTLLQPIVRMSDRVVLGYEALSRGPAGAPLERPDLLFDAAHACGRTLEMELLCAELALERTRGMLPPGTFLTINAGPQALSRASETLPLAGRREVLFELTEHLPLNQAEGLAQAVARLRARGVGLALDDTGCGFADMETARILRPDIVKLCITVVRNAAKGTPFVAPICETTARLLQLGCRVLAEGVETEAQHAALIDCRIELAQGWLYGRPADIDAALG